MDGGVGNDPAKDAGWHLSKSEKAMITSVGGFVAFACALAQYVSSGSGGITAFGISLGVSVAGGLLIVIAVRIFMNRGRKVTIRLLPALAWLAAALACAGAVGGVVGYFYRNYRYSPGTPSRASRVSCHARSGYRLLLDGHCDQQPFSTPSTLRRAARLGDSEHQCPDRLAEITS